MPGGRSDCYQRLEAVAIVQRSESSVLLNVPFCHGYISAFIPTECLHKGFCFLFVFKDGRWKETGQAGKQKSWFGNQIQKAKSLFQIKSHLCFLGQFWTSVWVWWWLGFGKSLWDCLPGAALLRMYTGAIGTGLSQLRAGTEKCPQNIFFL